MGWQATLARLWQPDRGHFAILVTWSNWKERNARVFNNTEKTVARLVEEIKDEARLWCQAGAKHLAALVVNPSSE